MQRLDSLTFNRWPLKKAIHGEQGQPIVQPYRQLEVSRIRVN